MSGAPILEFTGVRKVFALPKRRLFEPARTIAAVDGVDLAIHEGETVGLVGESGCGKSTLGRLAVRLETPTAGEVRFDGKNLGDLAAGDLARFRRAVQIVFQNPYASLDPRMTVGETIEEPLVVAREGTSKERRARAFELLDAVGLSAEHHGRYPHMFSGGQRQRIAIARALALRPRLLVCDEPVSALDVSIRSQIINLLLELQERFRLAYLFVSHDLGVVRHVSDRVAVMYTGRIVELAPTDALFAQPSHPYTRSLLAAIPVADPSVRSLDGILAGGVPTGGDLGPGCSFADRCAHVMPVCKEAPGPVLRDIRPGHTVRCLRAADLPPYG